MSVAAQLLEVLTHRLTELGIDTDASIAGLHINVELEAGCLKRVSIAPTHKYGPLVPSPPRRPDVPLATHKS